MYEVSTRDEIEQVEMERPHVVLLGAGASRAAFPTGDAGGHPLPLMADFTEIVPIGAVLERAGIDYCGRNFEELYAELCDRSDLAGVREDLEAQVFGYFTSLALPAEPTLYDHLVLSLRRKDVIATFNWDPFLIKAIRRNKLIHGSHPFILFLHGNVAAAYCHQDNVHGVRGARCSRCGNRFEPSRLLFPIKEKSYENDPAIADAWRMAREAFRSAFMVTIFGYGAPKSDLSASRLLDEAWGGAEQRPMEQFEIIDVRPEDELLATWESFIHTHHYETHANVYESWLFNHPRRSGEAYINQYLEAKFINDNPLPRDAGFDELWAWFNRLIDHERQGS